LLSFIKELVFHMLERNVKRMVGIEQSVVKTRVHDSYGIQNCVEVI